MYKTQLCKTDLVLDRSYTKLNERFEFLTSHGAGGWDSRTSLPVKLYRDPSEIAGNQAKTNGLYLPSKMLLLSAILLREGMRESGRDFFHQ